MQEQISNTELKECREAFEKWYRKDANMKPDTPFYYTVGYDANDILWEVWQAAWNQRTHLPKESLQSDVKCNQCESLATLEVKYTNVSDTWYPICQNCQSNNEAESQEVIDHEMKHFGGAYGVPTWETRKLEALTHSKDKAVDGGINKEWLLKDLERLKKLTFKYKLPKEFDGMGQTLAMCQGILMTLSKNEK